MAGIAAIAGWWLSQQRLRPSPGWRRGRSAIFPAEDRASLPAAKIGLGVFLAVVGSLFALFVSAYSMRMQLIDWRSLPCPGCCGSTPGADLSSGALQWAQVSAHRNDSGVLTGLLAGGATPLFS
jgi:cytochrome c oxidase subunit 3